MKQYNICTATALLYISPVYWNESSTSYCFDITFQNLSYFLLENLHSNLEGLSQDEAANFYEEVKTYFKTGGIWSGTPVSILFSDGQILAIGAHGKDVWYDVRDGVSPVATKKSFSELGIDITSLKVY